MGPLQKDPGRSTGQGPYSSKWLNIGTKLLKHVLFHEKKLQYLPAFVHLDVAQKKGTSLPPGSGMEDGRQNMTASLSDTCALLEGTCQDWRGA